MVRTAKPDVAAQFRTRGYVITEDADLALKDLSEGLDAIATLVEERQGDVPEMSREMWAGLIRTFSRQAKSIRGEASYANEAMARTRDD